MPSASRPEPLSYSISDLAKEFALTTRTIRFYEDEGLLSPRRAGSRRVYAERERVRIKLILRGKRLGLSLSEIRELLDLYGAAKGERAQLTKFLQVLGLRRGASRDEIVRSHRTVMKKWHPDQGGTADLAVRANEAKEVLMRRYV